MAVAAPRRLTASCALVLGQLLACKIYAYLRKVKFTPEWWSGYRSCLATQRNDGCQCQALQVRPHPLPLPPLYLPPPLASSAWLSHSSATLKNFQKCIVSTQSGKLSLPKPSGRVAWGLSVRGSSRWVEKGGGGRWGKQSSLYRRVVRSTFSASMRVYFTAKAFTNEWMSASKTAKQATPPLSAPLPCTSTCLFQALPPTFTSASSGIRLRAAAFCWAFVFSASCVVRWVKAAEAAPKKSQCIFPRFFLDFSFRFTLFTLPCRRARK